MGRQRGSPAVRPAGVGNVLPEVFQQEARGIGEARERIFGKPSPRQPSYLERTLAASPGGAEPFQWPAGFQGWTAEKTAAFNAMRAWGKDLALPMPPALWSYLQANKSSPGVTELLERVDPRTRRLRLDSHGRRRVVNCCGLYQQTSSNVCVSLRQ